LEGIVSECGIGVNGVHVLRALNDEEYGRKAYYGRAAWVMTRNRGSRSSGDVIACMEQPSGYTVKP
jgi:hypothetical protein